MADAVCRSCNAPVIWARLDSGSTMPVDPGPTPMGNVILRRDLQTGSVYGRVLRAGEEPAPGEQRRTSHFATCPNAAKHRRRP